ncbi:MAG: hypothetical protein FJX03_07080 [Alphaproteobacteria bacterium]|nr:hypothetical protein [Alphaproteobacteria bacterium]
MIWIFNLDRASAGLCDNYADVMQYIIELERIKQPANHRKTQAHFNVSTLGTNAEKKKWCIEFCQSNNYIIVETPSEPLSSPSLQRNHQSASATQDRIEQIG